MKKITFYTEATTTEALRYIAIYSWVVIKNMANAIDKAIHRFPWVAIIATVTISFIICFVEISSARAERDSYNQQLLHTTQQLKSYQAAFGK